MKNYTGICVYRLSDNIINGVRVRLRDSPTEIDIDPTTYIRHGAHPSLNTLPDCRDLLKQKP